MSQTSRNGNGTNCAGVNVTLLNDLKVSVNRTPCYAQNLSLTPFQLVVAGFMTPCNRPRAAAYSLVDSLNFSFGR